jgi:hypothetical protein
MCYIECGMGAGEKTYAIVCPSKIFQELRVRSQAAEQAPIKAVHGLAAEANSGA